MFFSNFFISDVLTVHKKLFNLTDFLHKYNHVLIENLKDYNINFSVHYWKLTIHFIFFLVAFFEYALQSLFYITLKNTYDLIVEIICNVLYGFFNNLPLRLNSHESYFYCKRTIDKYRNDLLCYVEVFNGK